MFTRRMSLIAVLEKTENSLALMGLYRWLELGRFVVPSEKENQSDEHTWRGEEAWRKWLTTYINSGCTSAQSQALSVIG